MNQELVLYPAIVVVMLTFTVGVALLYARVRAVMRREVPPRYFSLKRGAKMPDHLLKLEQNFTNLFEVPVLFYFATLTLYVSEAANPQQLALLWGFAVSRIAHSAIHTTSNNLRLRALAFSAGGILLMMSWILQSVHLLASG